MLRQYSRVHKPSRVVARTESELAKRKFEDKLVQKLQENGQNAVPSYTINPANISSKPNEKELENLKATLINNGFDGAIVTHLVNSEQYTEQVNNPYPYASPMYYRRFGRYYVHYNPIAWDSPTIQTNTRYFFESALYVLDNTNTDNLQWVGQFKVSNPQNLESTFDNYTTELVDLLIENSLSVE